jgi:L-fucose isomerase
MGIPAFKIYGKHVQDLDDLSIPDDVQVKLLQFARAGLTAATLRGKSYLSIGSVSMGIAGCIVSEQFYHKYLGMRNAYVDMTEVLRRINQEIYDKEEFAEELTWVRNHCKEGHDENPVDMQFSRDQNDNLNAATMLFGHLLTNTVQVHETKRLECIRHKGSGRGRL